MDEFGHSGWVDFSRSACGFRKLILPEQRESHTSGACVGHPLFFLFDLLLRRGLRSRFLSCRTSFRRLRLLCGSGGFRRSGWRLDFLPLLLSLRWLIRFGRSRDLRFTFGFLPALHRRRRRWRRRRWFERFQKLDGLGARTQLAIEQKQENIFGEFRVD